MLNVCLLAPGGVMPFYNRFLTSMIASCNGSMVLVDCGEGTQILLKKLKWGLKNIDIICFTHYHADHIAGLPGLLSTIGNSGREDELILIGPQGLKKVVEGLLVITPELPYDIKLIETSDKLIEYKHKDFVINSLPVKHSIDCMMYSVEVMRRRKFDKDRAEIQNVPMKYWNRLQKEEIIEDNGIIYTPDMVLSDRRKGLKVCYCTDTRPLPEIVDFIKGSDLFICEGMHGDETYTKKIEDTNHMLFSEAANLSKEGEVKELWLTHFSPALQNPYEFLDVAKNIFQNSAIGEELMVKELKFTD
ncbi:ribonuclease Z [Tepidibacter aestuarii]|uniref:ribonuclease Z n=1 Tax=Tepidibacter aestuarii TaxID=2925782 RepID=UPI0020BDFD02|nr:ribonuclease Z [Tepidibacter aestuarii]CAH2213072.1 Ribonuclease Z [Tepidibacter aestuarii]